MFVVVVVVVVVVGGGGGVGGVGVVVVIYIYIFGVFFGGTLDLQHLWYKRDLPVDPLKVKPKGPKHIQDI